MKKIILPILLLLILQLSCKDNGVTPPPKNNPPGWQEDIPWPSLADSPWPMNHNDPQNTGRYKGRILINGSIDFYIDSLYLFTGISISPDSNIYFCSSMPGYIHSYNINGIFNWKVKLGNENIYTTPLIDNNGNIYCISGQEGILYSLSSEGNIQWTYNLGFPVWQTTLNIDKEGNLYVIDGGGNLNAVSSTGTLLWKIHDARFNPSSGVAISISPDGRTMYLPGQSSTSLLALDLISQSIKWIFGNSEVLHTPVIDSQGNIYLFCKSSLVDSLKPFFFSITNDGKIRWYFDYQVGVNNYIFGNADPTIDVEGNIYFALDSLYSLDYSGNLKWKLDLDEFNWSPIICDESGTVIVCENQNGLSRILAIKNGNIAWQTEINFTNNGSGSSPALGFSKLFVPTWKSSHIITIR
ncbi:MAG: PQQ-like beta-propeller repeat protein [Ignavibacteriales bacterium]|nr:MAG: PQQ-like beta-propeller repeat protein [Ignavibacteriales bacterium]